MDKDTLIQSLSQCASFREIEQWVITHGDAIMALSGCSAKIVDVHLYRMWWSEQQPCSHVAPRGHEQNFMRTPDKPTGFPGWKGQMTVFYDRGVSFDDMFRNDIGLCMDGGSGHAWKRRDHPTGYKHCVEMTLFASDFPRLVVGDVRTNGSFTRDLNTIAHDVFHYDRRTIEDRANNWHDLLTDLDLLHLLHSENADSAYAPLWHENRFERECNYAARAFGERYPIMVDSSAICWKTREQLERSSQKYPHHYLDPEVLLLGNTVPNKMLFQTADRVIEMQLSGKISSNARVIDLTKRASDQYRRFGPLAG